MHRKIFYFKTLNAYHLEYADILSEIYDANKGKKILFPA